MPRINLTPAERGAVHGLLLAGVPVFKVAHILGHQFVTVRREISDDWVPSVGVRKGHGAKPTPEQSARRDAIIAMHDGGAKTLREVAEHFGVTRERIRQILRKHDIAERRGGGIDREVASTRVAAYAAALARGLTVHKAAASVGLSYGEVWRAARALFVPMPRPKARTSHYAAIAAYYRDHPELTGHAVAQHFGVADMAVSRAIRKQGVSPRRTLRKTRSLHEARS